MLCGVVGEECGKVKQASFYLDVWSLVCEGVFWCGGVVCGKVKQAAFYLVV